MVGVSENGQIISGNSFRNGSESGKAGVAS